MPTPYKIPISVKAIVVDKNKVWLRKNEQGEWELPGGKIDTGEQPEAALVREIREELGCEIEPLALVSAHILNGKRSHDESEGVLVLIYSCRLLTAVGELELDGEAGVAEFEKFSVSELESLPIPAFYVEAIKKSI